MNVTSKGRYALRVMLDLARHREDAVNCERAGFCLTLPMWKELDAITNAYLDSVRLSDLLTGERWRD